MSRLRFSSFRFVVLALVVLCPIKGLAEEPLQLRAAIHSSSSISEGIYDPEQIAALAEANDIDVVVITDRDLMRWEYGVWPLRNLFRRTVRQKSVFSYGIKRYLSAIDTLQKRFPQLVFLEGIESAPFYYWHGSPVESATIRDEDAASGQLQELRRKVKGKHQALTMYNWHRHLLALGLAKYADYRSLPIIGNPRGLKQGFSFAMIWPLALLIFGLWLCFTKKDIHKRQRIIAGVVIGLALVFSCNNWPFLRLKFDQYRDSGTRPYQHYIDYVHRKGGLVFWAHPEAEYNQSLAGIDFITTDYTDALLQIDNYAGFCVFPEGYSQIGRFQGIWDELLRQYCRGARKRPVWVIAGLAFEKGDLRQAMRERSTVILSLGKNKGAALDALRQGRMYALQGRHSLDFFLDEFYVTDSDGSVKGLVGDTVLLKGNPSINISGRLRVRKERLEIKIMRNGQVFKRYIMDSPFDIVCIDKQAQEEDTKFYYRIEITGKGLQLLTNPIFVERQSQ